MLKDTRRKTQAVRFNTIKKYRPYVVCYIYFNEQNMSLKNITRVDTITGSPMIIVSSDGYMRLTFEEFQQTLLVHLISGLDEDNPALLQEGTTFAEMTGYTEWVSTTRPAISIGWDWMFQSSQVDGVYYKRTSKPRSNLMLVDAQQRDLESTKTTQLIETVVDGIIWQTVVQNYISTRYAS